MSLTRSVNSRSRGVRVSLPVTGSEVPDAAHSESVVSDQDLLSILENVPGNRRFGIRGDGRLVITSHNAEPVVLADDDFWVEIDGGVPVLYYRYAGTTHLMGGSSAAAASNVILSTPSAANYAKGVAVIGTGADITLANAASHAAALYGALGVTIEVGDAFGGDVRVGLEGYAVSFIPSEITYLTGVSAFVTGSPYFLGATAGRWSADPVGAGAEVVVPLGVAIDTTTFLVRVGAPVVLV